MVNLAMQAAIGSPARDLNKPRDKYREEDDLGPLTSSYEKYQCFPDVMMNHSYFQEFINGGY